MSKNDDPKRKGQKYQNKRAYAVCSRLSVLTPQQSSIKHTEVAGLCKRCTGIIEWKIKYGKYKPLTVPKKCLSCGMKSVTRAYFSLCKDCAEEKECCPKCQGNDVIGTFPDSDDVKVREMNYLKEEMKYMKERERRKLVREMDGKPKASSVNKAAKPSEYRPDTSDEDLDFDENISENELVEKIEKL